MTIKEDLIKLGLDPEKSIQSQLNDKNGWIPDKVKAYFDHLINEEGYHLVDDVHDLKPAHSTKLVMMVEVLEDSDYPDRTSGTFFRSGGIMLNHDDDLGYFVVLMVGKSVCFQYKNFVFGVQKRIQRGLKKFVANPAYLDGPYIVYGKDGKPIFAGKSQYHVDRFKNTIKYKNYLNN